MDNNYIVPEEIKGWNWGAFIMPIQWGIGHKAYLTLLSLVPFLGFIWMFVSGAKGNEWAWKAGNYQDVESFLMVQDSWNRSGKVTFILSIIGLVIGIILMVMLIGLFASLGNSYYY